MWCAKREECVLCHRCNRLRWDIRPCVVGRDPLCILSMWRQWPVFHFRGCRYDEGYQTTQSSDSENEERAASSEVLTFQPMGSQRMEMRKRQTTGQQDAAGAVQAPPDPGTEDPTPAASAGAAAVAAPGGNEEGNERNRRSSYETKTDGATDCDQSRPAPSVEEVRCWGQSFDKLMKCPAGRCAFREFLRTEFSEENMLFWQACEDLRSESNKTTVEEKARLIYEDYVSILSPKEVSLDSRVREVINRNMLEPTVHTFDDAQLQIYTLMQRDSYPRYINSSAYKTLLKTVSDQSPES